jgi:hypothetical protein
MIDEIFIKRTKLKPYGFRYIIIIDNFKIENYYIGYKTSKSTAYRKGFSLTNETDIFNKNSLTSETDVFN